jgi:hypothetical protein
MSEDIRKHPVELTLEEVYFLESLIDEEEFRLENNHSDITPEQYPHIESLRDKFFNARLILKHESI